LRQLNEAAAADVDDRIAARHEREVRHADAVVAGVGGDLPCGVVGTGDDPDIARQRAG